MTIVEDPTPSIGYTSNWGGEGFVKGIVRKDGVALILPLIIDVVIVINMIL